MTRSCTEAWPGGSRVIWMPIVYLVAPRWVLPEGQTRNCRRDAEVQQLLTSTGTLVVSVTASWRYSVSTLSLMNPFCFQRLNFADFVRIPPFQTKWGYVCVCVCVCGTHVLVIEHKKKQHAEQWRSTNRVQGTSLSARASSMMRTRAQPGP